MYTETKEYGPKRYECYKNQLLVARNMGDWYMQFQVIEDICRICRDMVDYSMSMRHYYGTGEYAEGMSYLEACLDLLKVLPDMANDSKIMMVNLSKEKATMSCYMGTLLHRRSVTENGIFLYNDAKRAADLHIMAARAMLGNGAPTIHEMFKLSEHYLRAGKRYSDGGYVDMAIECATLTTIDAQKVYNVCGTFLSTKWMYSQALLLTEYAHLQKFYQLTSSVGQPFDGDDDFLQRTKVTILSLDELHQSRTAPFLAQVHYILRETDDAYRRLVIFLDNKLLLCSHNCSGCDVNL